MWLSVARPVCRRQATSDVQQDERPSGRAQRDTRVHMAPQTLLISIAIFYCIRLVTANQCNSRRIGMTWSNLRGILTSLEIPNDATSGSNRSSRLLQLLSNRLNADKCIASVVRYSYTNEAG